MGKRAKGSVHGSGKWRAGAERQKAGKEAKAARKRLQDQPLASASLRPSDPSKAYYAHLENIRRHMTIDDDSRVDAMIALRMRANGHSRETVAETIRTCAPTIRENPKGRDWQRYAERTAEYAFGMGGDYDMARNQRYWPLWRKVEGLGEEPEGTGKHVTEGGLVADFESLARLSATFNASMEILENLQKYYQQDLYKICIYFCARL